MNPQAKTIWMELMAHIKHINCQKGSVSSEVVCIGPSDTSWTAVNHEPHHIIWVSYVMQFYVQTFRNAPQSRCREDCGPKEAFLFKGQDQESGGCIIKTGSKRYCTKEGCSSKTFVYSTNITARKEVHFTSGLSSSVYLQGYMTWLR